MKQTTNKRPQQRPVARNVTTNDAAPDRPSFAPDVSAVPIPASPAPTPTPPKKRPAPVPRLEPSTPASQTPAKASTPSQPRAVPIGKKTPTRPARPARAVPKLQAPAAAEPSAQVDAKPAAERADGMAARPQSDGVADGDVKSTAAEAPHPDDTVARTADAQDDTDGEHEAPDVESGPAPARPASKVTSPPAVRPAPMSARTGARIVASSVDTTTPKASVARTGSPSATTRPPAPTAARLASGRLATVISLVPVLVLVVLLVTCGAVALTTTTQPATPSAASDWLIRNVDHDQRLIVDSAMAADLQAAGWDGDDALWTMPAGGRAVQADAPDSWRDADYVVTTTTVRDDSAALPEVAAAIANSVPVAAFGNGDEVVEVRKVVAEGALLASVAETESAAARATHGAELAENAGVQMSDADEAMLTDGRVDARIISVLGALAAEGGVTVTGFPVVDGERDRPLRQVAISAVGDEPLVADGGRTAQASALIDGLLGRFTPDDVLVRDDNLILRYSPSVDAFLD